MTTTDSLHGTAGLNRRQLLVAMAVILPAAGSVQAAGAVLPVAGALPEELNRALAKGRPLVVMVSLKGCPFCEVARNNYLAPMLRDGLIDVVQVDMRTSLPLTDFQGKGHTHEEMVRQWKISIAPTVLFFGKGGVEVAERTVALAKPRRGAQRCSIRSRHCDMNSPFSACPSEISVHDRVSFVVLSVVYGRVPPRLYLVSPNKEWTAAFGHLYNIIDSDRRHA